MKKTALISALLALLMLASCLFAACGKGGDDSANTTKSNDAAKSDTADDENTTKKNDKDDKNNNGASLSKIGTVDDYEDSLYTALTYEENEKYGLLSLEGKKVTKAVYEDIEEEKGYFIVTAKKPADENDFEGLNSTGLIDIDGKEIIPAKYAIVEILNDRYARVVEGTGRTDNKDESLFYMHSGFFSLSPSDGDPLYTGNWCVYDLTTGKQVEGVQGTKAYRVSAYGEIIEYVTDAEEYRYVNAKGEEVEDKRYFDNGCYTEESGNDYVVYDSTGKSLFTCKADGYIAVGSDEDYFVGRKSVNGNSKYVIMDGTGKALTEELSDYPYIDDGYVRCDDGLFDLEGNQLLSEEISSVHVFDRGNGLFVYTGEKYVLLDKNGEEVLRVDSDDDKYNVNSSSFTVSKEDGDANNFFCWKDKDFTIKKGFTEGSGFVGVYGENNTEILYDSATGEEVLSGYENYYVMGDADTGIYIFAENADDTYDIYRVD